MKFLVLYLCITILTGANVYGYELMLDNRVNNIYNNAQCVEQHEYSLKNVKDYSKDFHSLFDEYKENYKKDQNYKNSLNLAILHKVSFLFGNKEGIKQCANLLYKAKELNPKSPEPYNQIGLFYVNVGNAKACVENYKKALFLSKNNEYTYCNEYLFTYYMDKNILFMADYYHGKIDKYRDKASEFAQQKYLTFKSLGEHKEKNINVSIKNNRVYYKNKNTKFSAIYPLFWVEVYHAPITESSESYLILSLEEIVEENKEFTNSSIGIVASLNKKELNQFIEEKLTPLKKRGEISKINSDKYLKDSICYLQKGGKFISTFLFVKKKSVSYFFIFETTKGAFNTDEENFIQFVKNVSFI
ncbi:MAG: hypothetical protein JW864_14355 [Spirochaetes bacterium]|nr:hypothetical protein [Spirochaetota bacterium]